MVFIFLGAVAFVAIVHGFTSDEAKIHYDHVFVLPVLFGLLVSW